MNRQARRSLVTTLVLSSALSAAIATQTAAQTAEQPPPGEAKQPQAPAVETAQPPPGEAKQPQAPAAETAQPPPGQAKQAEAPEVQTIVVTGSNVPTTPDAVAVPVSILDADTIAAGGVTSNALEILRKSIPSFVGRGNTGNSNANNNNQNTAGGSQAQLRNLDTLVLVNGRRVANSGIGAIGGKNFVDLNQIPVAAIDRIEVLTDGASAIYGSDAIGGVVNIILKSNYQGAEIGGRLGFADGPYRERSEYFVGGADLKGVNLTLAASYSHTDPLFQNQRPFSTPLTGRSSQVPGAVGANGLNPGALLAPGLNSPRDRNPTGTAATATSVGALIANGTYLASTPAGVAKTYDLSPYQTLLLEQNQDAFAATLSTDLLPNGKLAAFADFLHAKTRSFAQFLPVVTAVNVPAGAPYNPLKTAFPQVQFGYLPQAHQFFDSSDSNRVTAGLRGDFSTDWTWEAAYVYSESLLDQLQAGVIYKPNLSLAIAGGYGANGNPVAGGKFSRVFPGFTEANGFVFQPALDPFARAAGAIPGSLANLLGTEDINAASRLQSVDGKVVGSVLNLPAGKLGVAVGASYRHETLGGGADPNGFNTGPTSQRWIGGTFADPFTSGRSIDAAFTEVRAPITSPEWSLPGAHALDLIGAARIEHYSDSGSSTVPKLGFRWQPVDSQFTVRGTHARSFTAPPLFAMFGPTDTRIVGPGVVQSVFGIPASPINGEDGNNPNLKPSKSKSNSIGFAFAPTAVKGLRISMDYSDINQEGFPGGIGFTNILQDIDRLGSASVFFNNLALGNFPGRPGATQPFTKPGDLGNYLRGGGNSLNLYAIDQFRNLGGIEEQSINTTVDYERTTDKLGAFTFSTSGSIFLHYLFQALGTQPFFEYAGYATNGGTGVQGTLPKYRFYSTIDWKYQEWDLTLGNNFIASVTDIGPGGIVFANSKTLKTIPVSSYTAWDLRIAYNNDTPKRVPLLKSWTVAAGVNNVFNRLPPFAPQAFTDNNVDTATYGPIGRLTYVTASAKF